VTVTDIAVTELTMQVLHDPDNGRYGDCWRTAIACLMGLPDPTEVPHFVADDLTGGEHYWTATNRWLNGHGYYLNTVWLDEVPPGRVAVASGKSPRGTQHAVLWRNGTLWHDPHPDRTGLTTVDASAFVLEVA
jgi:hypothetical protein